MRERAKDILVEEVMSKNPRTITPDMTAQSAAKLMRQENIGSLVVLEKGKPVGIVTEKDLVHKVLAEGKAAAKVKVEEIMSAPLITIGPKESVADASRKMADMRLRRLPVVQGGSLVGIITENDVLRLSPSLIELTREWSKIGASCASSRIDLSEGYCESCGTYSSDLAELQGMLLCEECFERQRKG
ncbi:MAG: CBS domain-containing protein [Methanomassiliicoccales archaeon]